MVTLIEIAIVGLIIGAVGGLLGIGGGIILIPALTEVLGPDQHLYQASAMIVYVFVAMPAVYQHRRAGLVVKGVVVKVGAVATAAVVVGVALSEMKVFAGAGEAYLRLFFGVFLLACGVYEVYRARRGATSPTDPPFLEIQSAVQSPSLSQTLCVAIPTGFYTGFLGVGGGIVSVPMQRRVLRMPLRNAIANSSAMMIATCAVGAAFKNYAYFQDQNGSLRPFVLAAVLIPTAIAGSLIGSRGTARLPIHIVRAALVLVLLVSGARMLQGAIRSLLTQTTPQAISANVLHRENEMVELEPGAPPRSTTALLAACNSPATA